MNIFFILLPDKTYSRANACEARESVASIITEWLSETIPLEREYEMLKIMNKEKFPYCDAYMSKKVTTFVLEFIGEVCFY